MWARPVLSAGRAVYYASSHIGAPEGAVSTDQKSQVDELFGDEELGVERPRGEPTGSPPPKKSRSKVKLALVGLVVIVVGLFWYVSDTHHDQYYLKVDNGMVRVERGYFFPVGAGQWGSSNPAYSPFRLPAGVTAPDERARSREEVDTVLYELYVDIARRNLKDQRDGDVDVAEDMIRRANKLEHSPVASERKLRQLRGDVAFRRGLIEVRGIHTRFDMALEQFGLAAQGNGEMSPGAQQWVDAIYRMRNDFRRLAIESGLDPDLILSEQQEAPKPVAAGEKPAVPVPEVEDEPLPPEPHEAEPEEVEEE